LGDAGTGTWSEDGLIRASNLVICSLPASKTEEGDFREVRTSRMDSFGFPPPQFVVPSLETIFAALKDEKHPKNWNLR